MLGLRGVEPDRWLAEGETVRLGAHVFEVLHCPGHTLGHVVFVSRAASFAILGDVLFQSSIGRTDFPYGDQAALIRSIREKVLPLGDDVAFRCGHGPDRRSARNGGPTLSCGALDTPRRRVSMAGHDRRAER